jgi:hypothetical protein
VGSKNSVVVITRTMSAEVQVSHPADWTPAEVEEAVDTRLIDINERAGFWLASTRTVVSSIRVGEKLPADDNMPTRDPVKLVQDDIDTEDAE